jgi:hypothetical protein
MGASPSLAGGDRGGVRALLRDRHLRAPEGARDQPSAGPTSNWPRVASTIARIRTGSATDFRPARTFLEDVGSTDLKVADAVGHSRRSSRGG